MAFGYFGKMAGHAGFVGAGLPGDFVGQWDAMVSTGLSCLRRQGGADWVERYLEAPTWRFALGPGAWGPQWTLGALMPSQDRDGDPYPLTLAWSGTTAPRLSSAWFDDLEYLALHCLNESMTAGRLERELAGLREPEGDGRRLLAGRVRFWTTDPVRVPCPAVELDRLPAGSMIAGMLVAPA